jgi:type IV fimbrial biogenesis protein FimT
MLSAHRPAGAGFSMIELMVGLTIMAIALALAAPSFADWLRNAKVRASAEALQSGLYFARTEAARRNAIVRFQLTDNLTSSCALSKTGSHWVVNMSVSTSPASACASKISDSSSPFLLKRSPVVSSSHAPSFSADRELIAFNGLGRLNDLGGSAKITRFSVDVQGSSGSCVADGGAVQCLRIVVTPGGQISMCDPAHSGASDPLSCP